jgi:predicted Zn-dependent protease with MMP-like domain
MSRKQPTTTRILLSAVASLTIGLGAVSLVFGFSDTIGVRVIQGLAVFAAGAVLLGGAIVLLLTHLAGWREPESEEEFEKIVERAERLAAEGYRPEYYGEDGRTFDDDAFGLIDDDQQFKALVRAAVDELPLEFHRALEHVAIVISDGGVARRAYGMYEGDTVARDYFHDRIVIFRDTLERDFGHDPELLKAQVTRTVRHELAHHLGWGEKGVRGLGL